MKPRFFKSPSEFRAWLQANHATARELVVGFYKKGTGIRSITWPESVDEALCFGWIDGVRHSIDERCYSNRFTPRRAGSNWSLVNTRRVEALTREGRMHPAGLAAFRARDARKTGVYSFERETARLPAAFVRQLRANEKAWTYFQAAAPYYRRLVTYWVVSAKQEATRARRLAVLIDSSAKGEKIPAAQPGGKKAAPVGRRRVRRSAHPRGVAARDGAQANDAARRMDVSIRVNRASERDVPLVLQMIRDLAEYERMSDQVVATESGLRDALFGARPAAEVLIAYAGEQAAGFALFFHNFSTFVGRRGLYLEDLFVKPEFRGLGLGKRLLTELARIAVDRRCGRLEWAVLDWNEPAIGFYKKLGARPMDDWTVFRLAGDALKQLAEAPVPR